MVRLFGLVVCPEFVLFVRLTVRLDVVFPAQLSIRGGRDVFGRGQTGVAEQDSFPSTRPSRCITRISRIKKKQLLVKTFYLKMSFVQE